MQVQTAYRQCAHRAAEICATQYKSTLPKQYETRLAALERRATEMETPLRDAFARFRRLHRRLKRLDDTRADTSRKIVECALELSKIVPGQRTADVHGKGRGEHQGEGAVQGEAGSAGGSEDTYNTGRIEDEANGLAKVDTRTAGGSGSDDDGDGDSDGDGDGDGESSGQQRRRQHAPTRRAKLSHTTQHQSVHNHNVLVRSELLERTDGMTPQLHPVSHAAHRLRQHGRVLQTERARLKVSCRDTRPLLRNAAVTLIQLHLRAMALRTQVQNAILGLDSSRQRSAARIRARVAAREASLLRTIADDPRKWMKLRVAPELRSLRLAEGFVDVRAWRRREWRMQHPIQGDSSGGFAGTNRCVPSDTSAYVSAVAGVSGDVVAQNDNFGWGAEAEQLLDQRERWFICLQRRTFGCGLPLAPCSELDDEGDDDIDGRGCNEFETSAPCDTISNSEADKILMQLRRAPGDDLQRQTKCEQKRHRRALHVYPIEEFSNKPVGRVVKAMTSEARRTSIHRVGSPHLKPGSMAEVIETEPHTPIATVDSVVFEKRRLGIVLDTIWIHRKRFQIVAEHDRSPHDLTQDGHHHLLRARLRCLCDILRLRRACLIAGTDLGSDEHKRNAKSPLSLSDLRALSSATAGACLARRARIAVISQRLESLRDELRRIRPVLACRHHAKHVQSHSIETTSVSTKLTKLEMATEAVVHCHYCGCVTKAGFSYVHVASEQSKLLDAMDCDSECNDNDTVRLEAALPRLDRVVAAAEAAAQALHHEKQARHEAQLGSYSSRDRPHHDYRLTAEQQETEALRHAAMLAVREARIWLTNCRLERKIRQLAASRAAAEQKHGRLGHVFRRIDACNIQRIVRGFCARRGVARAMRLVDARKQCFNRYTLLYHSATVRCSELRHTLKLEQQAKELHQSAHCAVKAAAAAAALAVRDAARHAAQLQHKASNSAAIAAILTAIECAAIPPSTPARYSGGEQLQRYYGSLLLSEVWRAHRLRKLVNKRCQAQHHAARELKCDKCGRSDFSSRLAFTEHMIAHARFDHRFCHRCGKRHLLSEEEIAAHAAEHAEADALLASAAQEHERSKHLLPAALKQQRRNLLYAERAFSDSLSKLQGSTAVTGAVTPAVSPLAPIAASRLAETHPSSKNGEFGQIQACDVPKMSGKLAPVRPDETVRLRWDKLSASLGDLGALLDGQRAVQRPLVQRREADPCKARHIPMIAPGSPHIPKVEKLAGPAGTGEALRHDPARVYGANVAVAAHQHRKTKSMKPRKIMNGKGAGRWQ